MSAKAKKLWGRNRDLANACLTHPFVQGIAPGRLAITALLARALELDDAARRVKNFMTRVIRSAPGLGHKHGPVNHWA